MKNKGVFTVLTLQNELKEFRNVIVYIENGVERYLEKYSFTHYVDAVSFLENNKEELDAYVTDLKNKEKAEKEAKEEEKRKKEEESKLAKIEEENKRKQRNSDAKRWMAGFLAGVVTLVGGHFAAKGIVETVRDSKEDSEIVSDETITSETTVPEETKYTYDYDQNVVIVDGEEYVELTTEEFENLVSSMIRELESLGINLSREDVIKFIMIVNCDKLAQDNYELITEIVGEQDADEVQQDAYKVISAIVMYNYNIWYSEGKTDNFIRLSDFIFDEEARNKVVMIENRVNEIALSVNDNEKMNELVHDLLLDLTNPQSELSYLESGVTFAAQYVLEPIRGLYGMDLYGNITLDDTNAELIKYFVPYAGDEQKYIDNNMLTGAIQNIHDILAGCPNHTLKKD